MPKFTDLVYRRDAGKIKAYSNGSIVGEIYRNVENRFVAIHYILDHKSPGVPARARLSEAKEDLEIKQWRYQAEHGKMVAQLQARHRLTGSLVIASAADISYEVYCNMLDHMSGKVLAFEFKLPDVLTRAFKDLKEFLVSIAKEFGYGLTEVIRAFAQRDVYALLKGIGFNIKVLWKAVNAFTSLVPRGLIKVFQELEKSGMLDKLRQGTVKLDEILHKHPVLARLSGLAIGGLLVWIWMSSSFTGNPDIDFNLTVVVDALRGKFSLQDLFLSPEGLSMIALFVTGSFTGIGVAWLGENLYNILVALVYTGAVKMRNSRMANDIAKAMHPKRM